MHIKSLTTIGNIAMARDFAAAKRSDRRPMGIAGVTQLDPPTFNHTLRSTVLLSNISPAPLSHEPAQPRAVGELADWWDSPALLPGLLLLSEVPPSLRVGKILRYHWKVRLRSYPWSSPEGPIESPFLPAMVDHTLGGTNHPSVSAHVKRCFLSQLLGVMADPLVGIDTIHR